LTPINLTEIQILSHKKAMRLKLKIILMNLNQFII